jgi:hypothetical protein
MYRQSKDLLGWTRSKNLCRQDWTRAESQGNRSGRSGIGWRRLRAKLQFPHVPHTGSPHPTSPGSSGRVACSRPNEGGTSWYEV